MNKAACPDGGWAAKFLPMPTTTTRATVAVVVYGPNLMDLAGDADMHVHKAGCADCQKYDRHGHEPWPLNVDGVDEVVQEIYPPDNFEYDPTDAEAYAPYLGSVKVFPCVVWPDQPEPPKPPTEAELTQAAADKAIAEHEDLEARVAAMPDEEFKYDPNGLRRSADRAYRAAVNWSARLTGVLHPRNEMLTSGRPKVKEPKAPRPGAAPKDGEITCVGLKNVADSDGCGKTKGSDKFPTTGKGDRATECRECRDERRERNKKAKAAA